MRHSDSIAAIAKALAEAQAELKNTPKTQQGYGYKYSDLSDVLNEIRGVFPKHKLAFTQEAKINPENNTITITTLLVHESGEWFEYETALPMLEGKQMNNIQAAGAALTYARRYILSAIVGISSEEDVDANVGIKDEKPATKTENKNLTMEHLKEVANYFKKYGLICKVDTDRKEFYVEGKTHEHMLELRERGFKFDPEKKRWVIKITDSLMEQIRKEKGEKAA